MRALVIEDYAPMRAALREAIESLGWSVDTSGDGEEGLWYATTSPYDVVVLDLMLPKLPGLEVLRKLRAKGPPEGAAEPAVLILSAMGGVDDRVAGLDCGADDYLAKPFSVAELKARVRSLARRQGPTRSGTLEAGPLVVDTLGRVARLDGNLLELTAREYAVLEFFVRRPGQVVSRIQLWEELYGSDAEGQSNVVDVYVGALRRKLRLGDWAFLHTRRGEGYLFEAVCQAETTTGEATL